MDTIKYILSTLSIVYCCPCLGVFNFAEKACLQFLRAPTIRHRKAVLHRFFIEARKTQYLSKNDAWVRFSCLPESVLAQTGIYQPSPKKRTYPITVVDLQDQLYIDPLSTVSNVEKQAVLHSPLCDVAPESCIVRIACVKVIKTIYHELAHCKQFQLYKRDTYPTRSLKNTKPETILKATAPLQFNINRINLLMPDCVHDYSLKATNMYNSMEIDADVYGLSQVPIPGLIHRFLKEELINWRNKPHPYLNHKECLDVVSQNYYTKNHTETLYTLSFSRWDSQFF